ncbi:4-carboxymuconolactone decarboxylase [Gammaproteobacteria bacterium]
MSKNFVELTNENNQYFLALQKEIPDIMKGFSTMHAAANCDGALSHKIKELIALAIGVSVRCDDCIGAHVAKLIQLGITRAELLEMLSVAIYMGGGPSLMYAIHALKAFEQFSEK